MTPGVPFLNPDLIAHLLELGGTRDSVIPYLGYVEVNLQIPGIRGYKEDVLLLVIPTTAYSEKVPVMVGSKIIDRAMGIVMKAELAKVTATWRQAHFSAVMSGSLQLPLKHVRGGGNLRKGTPLQQSLTPLHIGDSTWIMSRGASIPHGGLPFLHLGL